MPRKDQAYPLESRVPVAIYARVSTDNQVGGRFDSCESQAAVCRDYIQKQSAEGWYEVASFTDAAYSGGTMDRPGIQALKRMIQAGEVKVVLIFKLERVSRNMDEWGPFRAFLQKHGCRLESATENISELEPEGRLKNNIMMSVAEFERLNTAKKTRLKMREQAKRGYWNGGPVPYGYAYDKNTQALLPHPTEGPILKRIFAEAAKLTSLTDLANALNTDGHRTKQRVMQRRDGTTENVGGRFFRSDGLRLIIRNPIYRGAVKFEGQEFNGKHEPLVDADLWERANAGIAETKERLSQSVDRPSFQARDANNHLFKGIAWCAACGRALVPSDSGKKSVSGIKYRYYACSLVLKESQAPCSVGRLPADALEKAVVSVLGEAAKHPAIIKEIVEVSRSTQRRDVEELRAELAKKKQSITTVEKQLGNCADAIAKGGAEVLGDALVRRATDLRDERRRILVEQEKLRQELATADTMVLEEKRVRKNLERFEYLLSRLSPTEQKELVRHFIERIDVQRVMDLPRKRPTLVLGNDVSDRLMKIRIKLHDSEIAEGIDNGASLRNLPSPTPHIRGLRLDTEVDFKHANRGEVTLITPFRQAIRLEHRVRTVPVAQPVIEHPIHKALRWNHLLESGAVLTRMALARREGLTPGAITRIMLLLDLAPEIQQHLAALKTSGAIWHFGYRPMGNIARLSFEEQRAKFSAMVTQYESRRQRANSRQGIVSFSEIADAVQPKRRKGVGPSIG
jgi:DNA invertase Pin-like site-specific DNA recombinase